jgi:hypothetical protein
MTSSYTYCIYSQSLRIFKNNLKNQNNVVLQLRHHLLNLKTTVLYITYYASNFLYFLSERILHILERLDQGHLHPLNEQSETDISRPGIEPGPPWWEVIPLAKSYLNSLLNGQYHEIFDFRFFFKNQFPPEYTIRAVSNFF